MLLHTKSVYYKYKNGLVCINYISVNKFCNNTMTEKEKAANGEWYDANNDITLIQERLYAKDLCFDYNSLRIYDEEKKNGILSKLFFDVGSNCQILSPFNCDLGYNISVGDNFFANHNLVIIDSAKVTIGDNVFIGPNVGIYCAEHPIDIMRRNLGLERAKAITIGNNVWIGGGVHICPGVKIGDGAVIGAGSIVINDIPDNVVAVGNPCRVIRKIEQE